MPFGLLHHYSFYAYIFVVAVVFVGMKTSKSNLFSCGISMYKPNTFFLGRKRNFFLFDTYTRLNHHYLLRIEHLNSSVSWIHSTLHYCIRFKSWKSFSFRALLADLFLIFVIRTFLFCFIRKSFKYISNFKPQNISIFIGSKSYWIYFRYNIQNRIQYFLT